MGHTCFRSIREFDKLPRRGVAVVTPEEKDQMYRLLKLIPEEQDPEKFKELRDHLYDLLRVEEKPRHPKPNKTA
ncbi:MAG TPA: hypothetical protein VFR24_02465 [Candidatus Angelobacter sp.]|nr:hypothetical protein [Candidatus Angelobacter sp.]